jgi:hypothetical protein
MRKWRAENRDKNKQNDLRCRVYRLARQKFGEGDSVEKQQFIVDEINRRLGRRMLIEQRNQDKIKTEDPESNQNETADTTADPVAGSTITAIVTTSTAAIASIPPPNNLGHEFGELPFYCAPLHKIELPSINMTNRRPSQGSTEPSDYTNKSQPPSPSTSDSAWHEERKIALRAGSENSQWCQEHRLPLPPMQSILPPYLPFPPH